MTLCEAADDHAAVVVIVHPDGHLVLGISRYDDVWDWNLPGGGAEPKLDADVEDTARREGFEETGVEVGELIPIQRRRSATHCTTTFYAASVDRWPEVLRSEPFEGYVAWVEPKVLLAPTSRYREETAEALEIVGLL